MNQPTAIVTGLAVGVFARWLFLKQAPGGLPLALLLGIAGAMFTAFLMQLLGVARDAAALQLFLATAGAGVLLLGYRLDLSRGALRHTSSSRELKARAHQ
ncbi:MAG: GlsB/YeaQ/YmgE family stress response membrane protein [Prosthecobacter sp.]